jgi:glucose/arabinose dehydrogenase
MNTRSAIHLTLGLCCLAALAATMVQSKQTAQLKLEERELRAKAGANRATANPTASADKTAPAAGALSNEELLELMRLRNQVHQMRERLREMPGVRSENENLRVRLAVAQTNQTGAATVQLPPGYIRRKDAQFLGFSTPEATLQSLFWGAANHDTNVLFRAMDGIESQFARDEADFWKKAGAIPGFHILRTESQSDTEAEIKFEIVPGQEETAHAHKAGSDWKLQSF